MDAPGASGDAPLQVNAPTRLDVMEKGAVKGLPPVLVIVYVKTTDVPDWVIEAGSALMDMLNRAPV